MTLSPSSTVVDEKFHLSECEKIEKSKIDQKLEFFKIEK